MSDLFALIDVLCETYDMCWKEDAPLAPKNGDTFCNVAVRRVAEALNYHGFSSSMLANQMIDFMAGSVDWEKIQLGTAQKMANTGALVIATRKASPHGHIAVVRPGRMAPSGKWGQSPKGMNVGSDCFIGKALSWVFPGNPPDFYVWKET